MRRTVLLSSILLAGCGGAAGAPSTSSPSSTPEECTATVGSRLPAGWVDTGATLRITLKDKKPTGMEGRAADGSTHPVALPPGGEKAAMSQEICRLGGLLGLADHSANETRDGVLVIHVAKPGAASEKKDLELFCAGPPDPRIAEGNFDASQVRTLAVASLSASLTTPRWRSWLAAQGHKVYAAEGPAKDKVYAEMVAELKAAGAPDKCWFATALMAR